MRSTYAFALGLAVAMAAPTRAAAPEPKPLDKINACRSIADDAQRLACFDQAAAALESLVKTKDVVVIDRESLKQERRRQFGLVATEDPAYRAANVKEPAELKGKILSVRKVGQFYRLSLEGTGYWQTTEERFWEPVVGGEVLIRKGALGGYAMSYAGQTARIRRLQ